VKIVVVGRCAGIAKFDVREQVGPQLLAGRVTDPFGLSGINPAQFLFYLRFCLSSAGHKKPAFVGRLQCL